MAIALETVLHSLPKHRWTTVNQTRQFHLRGQPDTRLDILVRGRRKLNSYSGTMHDLIYMLLGAVIALPVVTFTILYLFLKQRNLFWKRLGVPGPEPKLIFGTAIELAKVSLTEAELYDRFYKQYDTEDYVGLYKLWNPSLLIRDWSLASRILEKDFNYFADRAMMQVNVKTDSIFCNLFGMKKDVWKPRRAALSKAFTPKKLKDYLDDMQKGLSCFREDMEAEVDKDVSISPLVRNYVIKTACMELFGLDLSQDEEGVAKFAEYADMFSSPPLRVVLKMLGSAMAPRVFKFLQVGVFPPEIYEYFTDLADKMISVRKEGNVRRKDILDAVIKMKEEGLPENGQINLDETAGHIFAFFQASFDTTELTLCHTLLQLALNPEVQDRAREEVEFVLKGSKEITYDHISQMSYLDGVLCETLRMYPPVGVLDRICTKEYRVDSKLTVPVGTIVQIPMASIHMDPAHFPNPEKFLPERFHKNEDVNAWFGFGLGPRICMGMRLVKIAIKLALATALLEYLLLPSDKMTLPMRFNPKTLFFTVRPVDGFYIRVQRRQQVPTQICT